MAGKVKLTIDGKKVTAPAGITILEAAEGAGIHIPNLCYLKGMKGIGACRLCMVEIEGMKAPMTACTARVKDGMVVNTSSEKINEIRQYVIDLIVSMHPLDCMTCTKAGVCDLQRYAYEYEVKESTFNRKQFGFEIDAENPFIKRDPDYCVLCGRCVRVCKEQGTAVLDFSGRGVGSRVTTAEDRPLHESGCTFCGSCVDACPVNALLEADRWRRGREWDYERTESVCLFCGDSCRIQVSTYRGDLAKVNIGGEAGRADNYICAYGRFGFDFVNSDRRILEPLNRDGDDLVPAGYREAVKEVATRLKDGENAGIILSGNLLNEDILTAKRFAADAGISNIDSTVSIYGDSASLVGGEKVDMDKADLILLVGLKPSQWERIFPALDATVRKRKARGAKLVVINAGEDVYEGVADIRIEADEAKALGSLARALKDRGVDVPESMDLNGAEVSEPVAKAADLYAEAGNPVVIASTPLFEAARNIASIKGAALSVPVEANAKGTVMLGIGGSGKNYRDMVSGGVKVLYVIGDLPVKRPEGVEFLIVQNSHMTDLAKEADIVLPATTFYEEDGTVVGMKEDLVEVRPAIEPYGGAKEHSKILKDLAREMGLTLKVAKTTDVKKALKAFAPQEPSGRFVRREDLEYDPEGFLSSTLNVMVEGSRLLWLREMEKSVAA